MIAFAQAPFNIDDSSISKISSPVLIISRDNDGLDKIELIKTYKLLAFTRTCQRDDADNNSFDLPEQFFKVTYGARSNTNDSTSGI